MNKFLKNALIPATLICLVSLLSFFKLSLVLGSHTFFFSGINFILPLIGALFSLPVSVLLISALFTVKAFFGFGVVTAGLPTLVAAASWATENKIINFCLNILLPLACIILFVLHPVAGHAFAYSFYWFIPVVLYALKYNNVFYRALSATFLAHAVGSIIWLYTVPMTSTQWLALIPVVAVERLVMTCGMVVLYHSLNWALNYGFMWTPCIIRIRH